MGVDVLATRGARASATMIFTMLNRINSVPARQWLIASSEQCCLTDTKAFLIICTEKSEENILIMIVSNAPADKQAPWDTRAPTDQVRLTICMVPTTEHSQLYIALTLRPLRDVVGILKSYFSTQLRIDILTISWEVNLSWVPHNSIDCKSILVQVMAWYLTSSTVTQNYVIIWPQ